MPQTLLLITREVYAPLWSSLSLLTPKNKTFLKKGLQGTDIGVFAWPYTKLFMVIPKVRVP
jgi:hypothetical protein